MFFTPNRKIFVLIEVFSPFIFNIITGVHELKHTFQYLLTI